MKLTVIQSPINQIPHQSILQRYAQIDSNKGKDDIQTITKRLSSNLKKIERKQPINSANKTSQFKQLKNSILNLNIRTEQKDKHNSQNHYQPNKAYMEDKNKNKPNVVRNLNFGAEYVNTKYNLQSSRQKTLNSFLEEIGQFKKSIKQIRQKFGPINPKNKKQIYSENRERHPYEQSRQKFSYTNYKDLSNKKSYKKTQDRWRSNEKSYSYIKNRTYIEQFTIDASNGETYDLK